MIIDVAVVAFVTFSAWRGRKRGLVKELPATVSITMFFLTGWGLFKLTFRGLSQASSVVGQSAGLITFVALAAGSVWAWRLIRARLRWRAEQWTNERQRVIGGAAAGGVRAFVLAATALLVLAHWPLHGMTRWIPEGSVIGRSLIRWMLPVYEKTHGAL